MAARSDCGLLLLLLARLLLVAAHALESAGRAAVSPVRYRWALHPAPSDFAQQAYHNSSTWSWGGALQHVPDDPHGWNFHLFAEVQTGGCGVSGWQTNGKVIHAASNVPEGPYQWVGDALPEWHTGPHIMRAVDGTYLLWAMGTTNASAVRPCRNGRPIGPATHKTVMRSRLYSSTSVYGPWEEVRKCASPDVSCDILPPAVNPNPVAQTLRNGTIIVMAGGENTLGDFGISVAQHWRGPYVQRPGYILFADQRPVAGSKCSCCQATPPNASCCQREQCFRWSNACGKDPRGVPNTTCHLEDVFFVRNETTGKWLWLGHQKLEGPGRGQRYAKGRPQCDWFPGVVGFAMSKTTDFFGQWEYDFWTPAAGLNVHLDNGTSYCLESRERPKLFTFENRSCEYDDCASLSPPCAIRFLTFQRSRCADGSSNNCACERVQTLPTARVQRNQGQGPQAALLGYRSFHTAEEQRILMLVRPVMRPCMIVRIRLQPGYTINSPTADCRAHAVPLSQLVAEILLHARDVILAPHAKDAHVSDIWP